MNTFGQNPKPVLQKSFERGIDDIKISPDKKHFITLEGDVQSIGGFDIKLWDYDSKLIITQHHFEGANGQGSGIIQLLNDGQIIYSSNHFIKKYNLLTSKEEVIFQVEWPEFIQNYKQYNNSSFVVSTKIYSGNEDMIYDITNKSILYIIEDGLVKTKKENEFETSALDFNFDNKNVIIGTNKGEAFIYDINLNILKSKLSFFKKKPIGFIHLTKEGLLIACPALPFEKKGYTTQFSEGLFKILNINNPSFSKTIALPKQKAPKKENDEFSIIEFHPSNIIKDIIIKDNSTLVISYGYNKIDFLEINNFKLIEKGPTNVSYDIGKIYLNPNSNEIIYSYGNVQMISNANKLAVYNTKIKKNTFEFKQKIKTIEKTKMIKHIGNNYYFTELLKSKSYNSKYDSITFQSPTYKNIKSIKCYDCSFTFSEYNDNWIIKNRKYFFIGKPTSTLIKNSINNFSFEYDYEKEKSVFIQEKLFKDSNYFELTKTPKKYYSPDILEFFENSQTLLAGLRKSKGGYFLAILNSDGSIKHLFKEKHNYNYKVSDNGKYFALSHESENSKITITLYDTSNWESIFNYSYKGFSKPDLFFDTTNQYFYFQKDSKDIYDSDTYELIEININKGINSLSQIHKGQFYNKFFVDREANYIYLNDGSYVTKIDYQANKTVFLKPSGYARQNTYLDNKINKIVVDGGDYLSFFDRNSTNSAEFYFFPENHFIGITNEGYYITTPNFPLENFGFAIGSKGYSFSQFDLLYNRPDKVLEFLQVSSLEEINLFNSAYKKRLKQQDINIEAISKNILELPESEIALTNSSFSTQQKDYVINASFSDKKNTLKSYNIWINGVPIHGSIGKKINNNINELLIEEELILSKGNNKIEVSCFNDKGLESLRKSVNIFYDAKNEKGNLIFVGIGVSKYQDSTYNLTYASKDVSDMTSYVKSLNSNYKTVDVTTLLDSEVTSENIKALKGKLKATSIEDKVIVFYAGHGLLDKNYDYYISTHDINFNNPIENGLAYKELEGLLDNIPARQKLLLIDACHSGEVDKENISSIVSDFDASHIKLGYRGSSAISVKDKKPINAFELMQNTFSDLRLGTGTTVISSSSGLEFAYEGETWNNGVFTYALLEGLKTGNADLNNDTT
ncbi:MAG: caspase family protein, partial [Flavobacteriaceae bacterium]|nr:caspase family protein [Flavobacteriaceae bacterium]